MIRIILVVALAVFSFGAWGQQACMPRDVLVQALEQRFKETSVAIALIDSGEQIEIFASRSGSWTIAMARGDIYCVVVTGQGWKSPETTGRGA